MWFFVRPRRGWVRQPREAFGSVSDQKVLGRMNAEPAVQHMACNLGSSVREAAERGWGFELAGRRRPLMPTEIPGVRAHAQGESREIKAVGSEDIADAGAVRGA